MDYKKKIEFNLSDYKKIDSYCKKLGIIWFASAWDVDSQIFLRKFKCKFNKVASAMLTNLKLIEEIAKERKHTFISTGMSSIADIKKSLKIFKKYKCKYTLMHCISTYPAEEKNLNLNMIKELKRIFKCDVGYSGHEKTVSPSITAFMLGATVIERHITLDRSMWGTDQSASLSSVGLHNLSSMIQKIPSTLGDGKKKFPREEKKMLTKFKYW